MSVENKKLEENRKTVVGFFQKALFEGDVDMAIRLYGGKTYTQHTPFAVTTNASLERFLKKILRVPRTQEVSNQLFFIIQSLRFRQCLKVSFAQRIIDWWISQQ
jgi:predicted SnoaL-like aldol condensation-catalyzing enzyme